MTGADERNAIIAWLDSQASKPSHDSYAQGWVLGLFNAAREIERGAHLAEVERRR